MYNSSVYYSVVTGNSATNGGGAFSGILVGCTITGNGATNGGGTYLSAAISCAFATNSAANGGGANQGNLYYCTLAGNWSTNSGGGAYGAELNSCLVVGNVATNGGGVYTGSLTNCTLSGNSAINGGGANSATLRNCIVYFNHGASGVEYSAGTLDYCCTTPQPALGSGNIASDPLFLDTAGANFHLRTNSPCINAGNNGFLLSATDLEGNPRIVGGVVDMGAYEFQGAVAPSILSQPAGQAVIVGSNATFAVSAAGTMPLMYQWNHEGTSINGATSSSLTLTNVQMSQAGNYAVTVTNLAGSITSSNAVLTVYPAPPPPVGGTHYVYASSAHPVSPYTNWATAAVTIQAAIDAALSGDEIIVTNGTYSTGTRGGPDSVANRVMVGKALKVRSVNGAQFTIIKGYRGPIATNYSDGIRCVYLTNGASLSGFTLTNGAANGFGGGLYCEWDSVSVSNCVIAGNAAAVNGGGVFQGIHYNCTISGNSATNSYGGGGGAASSTLYNCTVATNVAASDGGGVAFCTLNGCTVSGNFAVDGGGVYDGWLTNCLLSGNWATDSGGGAYSANLYNCTLVGNSATNSGGGGYGFDSFHIHANCTLYNSIIYSNIAALAAECECTQYDCCTPDNESLSFGNIPGPPLFADQAGGNFRLTTGSPCIDAGNNSFISASTDLDGNPRIRNGIVDIGAYEFQTGSPSTAPAVRIAASGQSIILAWPLWASNFTLVETGSAASPSAQWTNTPATPAVSNGESVVTIQTNDAMKFYRLYKSE